MSPEQVALIKDLGFPIAVAAYILWRIEPRLASLERTQRDGNSSLLSAVQALILPLQNSLEKVRDAMHELRRAQLLYVIGHPAFRDEVKAQASAMLVESAARDSE